MQGKLPQPQLKHLKDLDLNSIDKPKTLIILHYNARRISVPLFKEVFDLAELLYHHISTLEQKILSHDPDWQKKAKQQIVCFQIKKQNSSDKLGDGDLRSDIFLSLLRIQGEQVLQELDFKADVTKVYKYLEIQPYYRHFEKENQHYRTTEVRAPYLTFYRINSIGNNSNTYLARRITDGYFLSVKVYASNSKVGLSEARVVEHLTYIDEHGSSIRSSLLARSQHIVYIPHPQAESEQQEENAQTCRHIALIHPYFVRGTLQELLHEARYGRRRISEMDCLNYLKELMWGIHLLHEKYNLIHRALTPFNIFIDQNGQLKLVYFAFCVPCFDTQGAFAQYPPKTRIPKAGFSLQQLVEEDNLEISQYSAPELTRGQFYNYLVDFYSIGVIVKKLYEQSQALERAPVSQNNQNLMMAMIEKLTSSNLEERAAIANQILEDIAKEDLQGQHLMNHESLGLKDIKVGKPIELTSSKKFIQNQQNSNGIDHETVFNFFKQPVKPKAPLIKRQRKGSKQKLPVKNSREKSEKCFSKVSENLHETSQSKKRKLSNTKNRSFNNSHDSSKDSREKKNSQKNSVDSPAPRKVGKSKSQQRKKDPLTTTKLYTYNEQQKRPTLLPRSPKAATLHPRPKSPAMLRPAKK